MAREGITYDQVAQAADTLASEGKEPTIRAVREALGTGSPNTVHKHLTAWRAARPVATASAAELPATLTAAIADEIVRAAAKARAEIEGQLVQARAEAADLATAGDALESERDGLKDQVTALTTERDTLAGKAEQQAADLLEAQQRIEREQQAAEAARVELATARLKVEAQSEKTVEQGQEITRLRAAIEAESKARITAEQQAAVTAARLEATERRAAEAEAREMAMRKLNDDLARQQREAEQMAQERIEALRKQHHDAEQMAQQRLEAVRQQYNQEREQRAVVERELAKAQGQLEAAAKAAQKKGTTGI